MVTRAMRKYLNDMDKLLKEAEARFEWRILHTGETARKGKFLWVKEHKSERGFIILHYREIVLSRNKDGWISYSAHGFIYQNGNGDGEEWGWEIRGNRKLYMYPYIDVIDSILTEIPDVEKEAYMCDFDQAKIIVEKLLTSGKPLPYSDLTLLK